MRGPKHPQKGPLFRICFSLKSDMGEWFLYVFYGILDDLGRSQKWDGRNCLGMNG
jgi:hypothetical protein